MEATGWPNDLTGWLAALLALDDWRLRHALEDHSARENPTLQRNAKHVKGATLRIRSDSLPIRCAKGDPKCFQVQIT